MSSISVFLCPSQSMSTQSDGFTRLQEHQQQLNVTRCLYNGCQIADYEASVNYTFSSKYQLSPNQHPSQQCTRPSSWCSWRYPGAAEDILVQPETSWCSRRHSGAACRGLTGRNGVKPKYSPNTRSVKVDKAVFINRIFNCSRGNISWMRDVITIWIVGDREISYCFFFTCTSAKVRKCNIYEETQCCML